MWRDDRRACCPQPSPFADTQVSEPVYDLQDSGESALKFKKKRRWN